MSKRWRRNAFPQYKSRTFFLDPEEKVKDALLRAAFLTQEARVIAPEIAENLIRQVNQLGAASKVFRRYYMDCNRDLNAVEKSTGYNFNSVKDLMQHGFKAIRLTSEMRELARQLRESEDLEAGLGTRAPDAPCSASLENAFAIDRKLISQNKANEEIKKTQHAAIQAKTDTAGSEIPPLVTSKSDKSVFSSVSYIDTEAYKKSIALVAPESRTQAKKFLLLYMDGQLPTALAVPMKTALNALEFQENILVRLIAHGKSERAARAAGSEENARLAYEGIIAKLCLAKIAGDDRTLAEILAAYVREASNCKLTPKQRRRNLVLKLKHDPLSLEESISGLEPEARDMIRSALEFDLQLKAWSRAARVRLARIREFFLAAVEKLLIAIESSETIL